MQKEAALEHVSLTKRGLLDYLGAQREPVTAKVASIDLDSRASTVTEMLERCVAQGLAERTTTQRPREYRLSGEGRRRLDLFRSKEGQHIPECAAELEIPESPRTEEVSLAHLIDKAVEAALEKRSQQSHHPDPLQVPVAEQIPSRRQQLKALLERANRLAHPEAAEAIGVQPHPCVRELLAVERCLSRLPHQELRRRRDLLRDHIGDDEVCEKISRLAAAEAELYNEKGSWWEDSEAAEKLDTEICSLKRDLGLGEEIQGDPQTAAMKPSHSDFKD
jgi:hypothetical protein